MYKFEVIENKEILDVSEGNKVYEYSEEVVSSHDFERIEDLPFFIKSQQQEEKFYLLLDYCVHKGKLKIFKGTTICVDRVTLVDYLFEVVPNDSRMLRIIPASKSGYVILVNDEGTGYLYGDLI